MFGVWLSAIVPLLKHGKPRPTKCKVKNRFARVEASSVAPKEAAAFVDG
jgi:hypothetical protein